MKFPSISWFKAISIMSKGLDVYKSSSPVDLFDSLVIFTGRLTWSFIIELGSENIRLIDSSPV
jgi:hypothetical protein